MQTPNSPTNTFTYSPSSPVGDYAPTILSQTDTPAAFSVYANPRRRRTLNFSNWMVLRVFVLHGRAQPSVGYCHDRCSVARPALDR